MRIKRILAALTLGLALIGASAVVAFAAHATDRVGAAVDADADPNHVANIKYDS